jgi:isocitrate/isopropylmalate dehydrogenase
MFQLDWDAIREAAIESRLMANSANCSNLNSSEYQGATSTKQMVSQIATLAISQCEKRTTDPVVIALQEAAMRCCDLWNDGLAARAEMVADIEATPHHLRQDLLKHFLSAYVDADTHLAKAPSFD